MKKQRRKPSDARQTDEPKTYTEALTELTKSRSQLAEAQKRTEAAQHKIAFFNAVAGHRDAYPIWMAPKLLNLGIDRDAMFEFLTGIGVLTADYRPHQEYIDLGYFRTIEQKFIGSDASQRTILTTLVYPRGLALIKKRWRTAGGLRSLTSHASSQGEGKTGGRS